MARGHTLTPPRSVNTHSDHGVYHTRLCDQNGDVPSVHVGGLLVPPVPSDNINLRALKEARPL